MEQDVPSPVRLYLLGSFRVERLGMALPASVWRSRRHARTLLKILALRPGHRINRHELCDILWPEVDTASALNRLGKQLHAARRVLQPDLRAHRHSTAITLQDDMLTLHTNSAWIDVDAFELAARSAIATTELALYQEAIALYGGELLPEDRYEDWSIMRRETLQALYRQVLEHYAHLVEGSARHVEAITLWQQLLELDPLNEEAHRALMRLYHASGSTSLAISQYTLCRDVLQKELGTEPLAETDTLYRVIRHDVSQQGAAGHSVRTPPPSPPALPEVVQPARWRAIVGRTAELAVLERELHHAMRGSGRVILIKGEAGVGKSRLMAEMGARAHAVGAAVLWGAGYGDEPAVPYGPVVDALEGYLHHISDSERQAIITRYPVLSRLLPSFSGNTVPDGNAEDDGPPAKFFTTIAAILHELSRNAPLVLALDDLHATDAASLHLLQYLARNTVGESWLILCTYREEEVPAESVAYHTISRISRLDNVHSLDVGQLAEYDLGLLLQQHLPGGAIGSRLIGRIYGLTLGNPLFVEEVLATLREHGLLSLHESEWTVSPITPTPIPRHVQELVEMRIAGLQTNVTRVLSLAAVLGME